MIPFITSIVSNVTIQPSRSLVRARKSPPSVDPLGGPFAIVLLRECQSTRMRSGSCVSAGQRCGMRVGTPGAAGLYTVQCLAITRETACCWSVPGSHTGRMLEYGAESDPDG
jgi:hypothetical protein